MGPEATDGGSKCSWAEPFAPVPLPNLERFSWERTSTLTPALSPRRGRAIWRLMHDLVSAAAKYGRRHSGVTAALCGRTPKVTKSFWLWESAVMFELLADRNSIRRLAIDEPSRSR
jgi:hypothetical protein